jgi:hypothetical protein
MAGWLVVCSKKISGLTTERECTGSLGKVEDWVKVKLSQWVK